jgi:hypothetical protein
MAENEQTDDNAVDFAGWFREWDRLCNAICRPDIGKPSPPGSSAFELKDRLIHTHASTFDDLRVQLELLKKLSWSESENGILTKTILEGFDQIRQAEDQGGT